MARIAPNSADIPARDDDDLNDSAVALLILVLGEGAVAALHEGFLDGGDFTGVLAPLLLADAGATPYLADAADAALATARPGFPSGRHRGQRAVGACIDDILSTGPEGAAATLRAVLGAGVVDALHVGFAQGGDYTGVVPLLVGAGAKPYLAAAARAALATACDHGLAGVAVLLLRADGVRAEDAGVTSRRYTFPAWSTQTISILAAAALRGDDAVVRALVDSGKADVNNCADGFLPLACAACRGHAACVATLLVAPGIDVNKQPTSGTGYGYNRFGNSALADAASGGHTAILRTLLAVDGIDVNLVGEGLGYCTALMLAAGEGHLECVLALLGADGIDVNEDGGGSTTWCTAAGHAAQGNHTACLHALLAAEGLTFAQFDDTTLLDAVVDTGDEVSVRAIIAMKGINLRHSDEDSGWTALHTACYITHAAIVTLLLVAGADRFAAETLPDDKYGREDRLDGASLDTRRLPLALADGSKEGDAVRAVFLSGVDYWQRRRHGGHSWAMRQVVLAVMLVRQRLNTAATAAGGTATATPGQVALVHLPEEIWLLMCGFLRSADFPPSIHADTPITIDLAAVHTAVTDAMKKIVW